MAPPNTRDPRFKGFRIAAYAVYMVVVVAFCGAILYSVLRSVREMVPRRRPPSATLLSMRECIDGVQKAFAELETQRRGFLEKGAPDKADDRWTAFRADWLHRFRDLEARCAPDAQSRKTLAPAFKRLGRLLDLYGTHATQFAGELGPDISQLQSSLEALRRDPAAGRLP